MSAFFQREATFADRHIGLTRDAQASMLEVVGYEQLEELMAAAIPPAVAAARPRSRSPPSRAHPPAPARGGGRRGCAASEGGEGGGVQFFDDVLCRFDQFGPLAN